MGAKSVADSGAANFPNEKMKLLQGQMDVLLSVSACQLPVAKPEAVSGSIAPTYKKNRVQQIDRSKNPAGVRKAEAHCHLWQKEDSVQGYRTSQCAATAPTTPARSESQQPQPRPRAVASLRGLGKQQRMKRTAQQASQRALPQASIGLWAAPRCRPTAEKRRPP